MSDIVEIVLAGERIKRLSDFAVENAVENNKQKYLKEFASIDKSDLDRHVYEGGLKVWECSYDLSAHLEDIDLNGKKVLELGCGAALPSIVALKKGASKVVCQDYNESVIELVTKPNLKLNISDESKFEAIAKSWGNFSKKCTEKFDYIVTSETIYDAGDYASLHDSMKAALKDNGIIILAAKMLNRILK
uniref:Uncharacterized protein n=1 Tax=Panagrolaimus sp. PS1159 TaxID=55785 RepID=A0AC35F9S8_9BILA